MNLPGSQLREKVLVLQGLKTLRGDDDGHGGGGGGEVVCVCVCVRLGHCFQILRPSVAHSIGDNILATLTAVMGS